MQNISLKNLGNTTPKTGYSKIATKVSESILENVLAQKNNCLTPIEYTIFDISGFDEIGF